MEAESNNETELLLAQLLARSWRAHLENLFPDRKFHVSVYDEEETGSIIGVGFYEVR